MVDDSTKILNANSILTIEDSILAVVPADYALRNLVIPVSQDDNILTCITPDHTNQKIRNELSFITGYTVELRPIEHDEVIVLLSKYYGETEGDNSHVTDTNSIISVIDKDSASIDFIEESGEFDDISIVRIVNKLIGDAIQNRASDIHIEPYEKIVRVRFRIDGMLKDSYTIPFTKKNAVVSRIKIISGLDIAEKRRPQDGQLRVKDKDNSIDIRVSTLPTAFGEKVVMRILEKTALGLSLDNLGFTQEQLQDYLDVIKSPYGIILVTGPTGSGKTTTLYSTLNRLNSSEVNIVTVEDPIEYYLSGINQTQQNKKIGYTFANALRSFLRQDPDILMVGEIRDYETAEIAVRASLTGHLVFSTIHTNDAVSTITRLIDMGIDPYLVAASVKMIIAQRLVRVVCKHCGEEENTDPILLNSLSVYSSVLKGIRSMKGSGCSKCQNTGYRGRVSVFETLLITDDIAQLITDGAPQAKLKKLAIKNGFMTMNEVVVEKLKNGITNIEEVLRKIN